jgi:hypothetical protein
MTILRDKKATLEICSDGGANREENKGSYGYVMSHDNKIVVEGWGNAWGTPTSSYRAEAFGKLAWLSMIKVLEKLSGEQNLACRIVNYCDNKAIIRTTRIEDTRVTSTPPLCSNYDVVNEINKLQQELLDKGVQIATTVYVKAHQDETTPSHLLSWPSQLNVMADTLATRALNEKYKLPQCGQLGECDTHLTQDGITQSSKENELLQDSWRALEIQQYYRRRLRLDYNTLHWINWAGLAKARRTMTEAQRKFLVKFTIGWLPVGKRQAMYGKSICDCHRCGKLETCDHIMQCSHLGTENERLVQDLATYLRKERTKEEIITALCDGWSQWLQAENAEYVHRPENLPALTGKAYHQQNKIGWGRLCFGMLSNEWSAIQEHHGERTIENRTLGDSWNSKVSSWIILRCQERWDKRNKEIHDPNEETDFITREALETSERVKYLYSREHELRHDDRLKIYDLTLEDRLATTTRQQKEWANTVEPTIKVCLNEEAERNVQKNQDIRNFFLPIGGPRPQPRRQRMGTTDMRRFHEENRRQREKVPADTRRKTRKRRTQDKTREITKVTQDNRDPTNNNERELTEAQPAKENNKGKKQLLQTSIRAFTMASTNAVTQAINKAGRQVKKAASTTAKRAVAATTHISEFFTRRGKSDKQTHVTHVPQGTF